MYEYRYKIELNVPLPQEQKNGALYPIPVMKAPRPLGKGGKPEYDSFFVPAKQKALKKKLANRIKVSIAQYRSRTKTKAKFKTLEVEGGVRCWRVA